MTQGVLSKGRYVHEATKRIPIIGDGDTGYGNAMNVKRTVRGYAAAGFAGILIEDQAWPKSCGHVRGKRVVSREEAVSRIRAAADARDEGADILILARSDARQAESLDEALARAAAFADAGADMLFIDALASKEEMLAFTQLGGAAAGLPKMANMLEGGGKTPILPPEEPHAMMANMLEGGGKTPILPPEELQAMGFKLVAYPLSLLGVSIRAMERALAELKAGQVPDVRDTGTFVDMQMAVGFPEYYEEEARYAISTPSSGTSSAAAAASSKPDSSSSAPRSKFFRVVIKDKRTGVVKLETRIPAGFIGGMTALIPQVAGVNFEEMVEAAMGESLDLSKPLLDYESGNDVITVFLE
ncbi:hypothetical protein OEZ85_007320 [Tetradesmus obliquus]|uniref:Isocitrate lyase n=1 Tax=Tetradesmus obliquus TaxID=3088 RepID=A0ABY8TX98_TETOB|nr:hypothetical protein OEZ85_007320 [Tetradesmus obliquus]